MASYPDLPMLELDVGRGTAERRARAPIWRLALALLPAEERALKNCLDRIAQGDPATAAMIAEREASAAALLPDLPLLCGALQLADGRCGEAVESLAGAYRSEQSTGAATRRLYPSLRFLLRVCPCVLIPLYPSPYAAGLMYGVALWLGGHLAEALEVAEEMIKQWGPFDELKLVAGQIRIARGELDEAEQVLSAQEMVHRDALELARSLYLALVHSLKGEYRSAARVLTPSLRTVRQANWLLMARARLLLSECYARTGLTLDALRESALIEPEALTGEMAAEVLKREQGWIEQLGAMTSLEVEQLALSDVYQAYVPDKGSTVVAGSAPLLATTRDPLSQLKPREQSWLKRQEEERQIAAARSARDRGEHVSVPAEHLLSGRGMQAKQSIATAKRWWPQRHEQLSSVSPRESLGRLEARSVGHLRFDYCGTREGEAYLLAGERRAAMLSIFSAAALLTGTVLWILRGCVY